MFFVYEGGPNYDAATAFISEKYKILNQNPDKKVNWLRYYCIYVWSLILIVFEWEKVFLQIHAHFTCATDTNQVQIVLGATIDTIVQNSMKSGGLLWFIFSITIIHLAFYLNRESILGPKGGEWKGRLLLRPAKGVDNQLLNQKRTV